MKLAARLLAVSAVCALWLAGPSAAWPAEPPAAKVVAVSGQVQAGGRALKTGDAVAEGDEIASGPEGRATLEFADRTVLFVRTDSRLHIEKQLRLDSGAVEVVVPQQGAPGFGIVSQSGNVTTRGAAFRARARPEGLLVEVVEGSVAVAGTAGAQVVVEAGHGTLVKRAEAPLAPVKLLDAPDISGIAALQEKAVVRLRFAPLAGAVRYRVVVAADRDLRDVIVESRPRRPDLRLLELDDGEYFYGVRAIDELGLDGREVRGAFRLKMPAQ
jgi:hypothetical protein